jgi:hypothetical protein
MENIQTELTGSKLVITVDVSEAMLKKAPLSSTGRSKLVATSHGFQPVNANGLAISLNVTKR